MTDKRTAAEVDFILGLSPIDPDTRFLDVGCGFGRHSIELAKRGYRVVGIDPAEAMIAAANERKAQLDPYIQPNVEFLVESGEKFTSKEKFDVVICLMTTLGQVGPDGENSKLLNAIYANLRPSGRLILEVPQKETAIQTLKSNDHFGSDTHYTAIEREYDENSGRVVERFNIVSPETQNNFLLSYRLFSRSEIELMLSDAGFKVDHVLGGFKGEPLTAESLNMVFVSSQTTN